MIDWNKQFLESFADIVEAQTEELDLNNPGKVIKAVMKTQGLTNDMLANKAGIHVNTIQGWTSGRRTPSFFNFMTCLNAMGYGVKLVETE